MQIKLMEYLDANRVGIEAELACPGLIGGLDEPSPSGQRPIHVAQAPIMLKFLISRGVDLYAKNSTGHTVWSLHAVKNFSALKILLEADCSCVDAEMPEIGGTMMQAACRLGLVDNIQALHTNYARIVAADLRALFSFAVCNGSSIRSDDLVRVMELAVKLPNNPKDATPCVRSSKMTEPRVSVSQLKFE
jgi:hypothetical protein